MKVKNIIGSSRFKKPKGYDSWLDYWEQQTGINPTFCSEKDCIRRDLVGAHVKDAFGFDKHWYIVPLCKGCNQRTDMFEVPVHLLVPVPSNLLTEDD